MTRDDRPKDPPREALEHEDDPDRAAILARRQRFIALALSGLATGCTAPPRPEPCLNVAQPHEPEEPTKQPEAQPETKFDPGPCLKVALPSDPPLEPPPPETTPPPPEPQPCLKVRPPEPKTEPTPCLSVARPRDPAPTTEPKPEPRPCLKVARPK